MSSRLEQALELYPLAFGLAWNIGNGIIQSAKSAADGRVFFSLLFALVICQLQRMFVFVAKYCFVLDIASAQ